MSHDRLGGPYTDKSKASRATKLLVLMQAGWLVIECATRVAGHLPLTLFGLNTISHVACAFAAYVLWWNKPFDAEQPVVLTYSQGSRSLVAAMCMFSQRILPPEIYDVLHFVPHEEEKMTTHPAGKDYG